MKIGAVILAGGKGSRMGGTLKAELKLGSWTFMEKLIAELGAFEEIILSVNQPEAFAKYNLPMVQDNFLDSGPLAGLEAALEICQGEALLAVSCDTPLFSKDLAAFLMTYYHKNLDAVVVKTRDGKIHPLCGIYHKRCQPVFAAALKAGERSIYKVLQKLEIAVVPLAHSIYPDELLSNINTPEDLRLLKRAGPPVIAVCGVKNSGKTTFVEGLVRALRELGLTVGTLKHDGHDFIPDVPGTDSFRHRQAGALISGVYSDYRYLLTGVWDLPEMGELLKSYQKVDVVIHEGGKDLPFGKIEMVRREVSTRTFSNLENMIAFATDFDLDLDLAYRDIPQISLEDYEKGARLIFQYIKKEEGSLG